MKKNYFEDSLKLHKAYRGKIELRNKLEINTLDELSTVYSPGVAEPCKEIAKDPKLAYTYTIKSNTVAVVTDGSAVLGLGNIGALASIPVMEGKAMLFKKFANIDAFPICLDSQDTDEIVRAVQMIAPIFGGINLEDISAPRSFEIETRLQNLGIPVFHDDQHGTAIVTLAGLINACKVLGKKLEDLKVVINGAGAAGIAITRLLRCVSSDDKACISVKEVILCDSKGIIHKDRTDLNSTKLEALNYTNSDNKKGSLLDALNGADVFIGVSVGDVLKKEDIQLMGDSPIIFALANPYPEIDPREAMAGGAAIVATGRSDYENQINNVLAFPGIFRGALDAQAPVITNKMKLAAAYAIADCITDITRTMIIPSSLDENIAKKVAFAVKNAFLQ